MSAAPGSSPGTPNLLGLKILVVGMGIAIVASVIVIVVAISNRLSEAEAPAAASTGAPAAAAAEATASGAAFGDLSIAVPEGCVMAEAGVEGNRLIVRLDGLATRGCQQVIMIDLASGTVLGRVTAEPSP